MLQVFSLVRIAHLLLFFTCIILVTLCSLLCLSFFMFGLCSWITFFWFPLESWFLWLLLLSRGELLGPVEKRPNRGQLNSCSRKADDAYPTGTNWFMLSVVIGVPVVHYCLFLYVLLFGVHCCLCLLYQSSCCPWTAFSWSLFLSRSSDY